MSTPLRLFLIVWIACLVVGFLLYGWALWPLSGSLPPDVALDQLLNRTRTLGIFSGVALFATAVTLWRVPALRTGSRIERITLLASPGALFVTLSVLHWIRLPRHYNAFAEQHQIVIQPVGGMWMFVLTTLVVVGATYLVHQRLSRPEKVA